MLVVRLLLACLVMLALSATPPARAADVASHEKMSRECHLAMDGLVTDLQKPRQPSADEAPEARGVQISASGGRIDRTPACEALAPEFHKNRVQERGPSGKIIRENPSWPDGSVLVTPR